MAFTLQHLSCKKNISECVIFLIDFYKKERKLLDSSISNLKLVKSVENIEFYTSSLIDFIEFI